MSEIPIALSLTTPTNGLQIGKTNLCGITNTKTSASFAALLTSGSATCNVNKLNNPFYN